ncbi:MAG: F0F1 ATP synthase subunit delta [Nitrospira sp.]|nr:F0F1 ATP synthase subunit delta [Nitrospira sp.]
MFIDWFTVVAQALNFLILVWLMKRFLYKPILDAIDAREKRIATELADAAEKKVEAKKERDEFKYKNDEFEKQRDELMSQATDEAKVERQRLLDESRQAADALRIKRQDALKREQQKLNDEIARRTREEVFAIARKTLSDLAGASLEERMSEVFTRRVRELNGEAKEGLAKALKTSTDPALVCSAFELPSEQRAAMQQALNETFSAEIHVRFETAPDVISGIELTANGRKVGWSIADYLVSLEKSLDELLKDQSKLQTQVETKRTSESGPDASKPEPMVVSKDAIKEQLKHEVDVQPKSGTKPADPEEEK